MLGEKNPASDRDEQFFKSATWPDKKKNLPTIEMSLISNGFLLAFWALQQNVAVWGGFFDHF